MRHLGIILLCILAISSCKTSSVTTTTTDEVFYEDLSKLRPVNDLSEMENESSNTVESLQTSSLPDYHLKAELDSVNKIIIQNNMNVGFVDGYTIQIYTGSNRNDADQAARNASALVLDIDPKVEYDQPNYKVKVGQYENRLEAHQIFERLKKDFPLALLIPERIPVDYD